MKRTSFAVFLFSIVALAPSFSLAAEPMKFLRFQAGDTIAYGLLEGDRVRQLSGDLFGSWSKTDKTHALKEVKLLPPTQPTQVLALAGNYRSHLRDDVVPPKFQIPQPFFKSPSCLVGHGEAIVLPKDAKVVHYEAELVVVIGKKCSKVSKAEAMDYVFGVTAGNDVSERIWQNDKDVKDVQWWRAKGADTFGPVGPYIATGIDYDKLMLRLRLNGEIKQEENTDHLIHDIASSVSFISQYITLQPGDQIFTGTPGRTAEMKAGDVIEIELEGVGVLRNPVVAEK
jgi:2-keto-4-pentenoate hydratase/2-oxohepta-3-ene-1,7-dioic acid hydratase in catechol pathway